ncbi:G-type lectin S-receptor-like serine/threonine-protein kinase LECRK4 [Durio zibethinus]|uniref:Receptor-like serine/threonine-protein kinase n=1 Tax=Durio zibethinus TaxID=66656 RepID=A0A6P5XXJ3_DURZI|nr:G-type lectin S-receptor-like serine/threonine-protein kinase LECRK4 [Durio zibethinus]
MISTLFHTRLFLLILVSIHWILATVQAQRNVNVGDSLSANDKTMSWQSPSGDFAFGFHPIPGQKDRFVLAIWYAKIPERTIVWYANRENPATDKDSKVELTRTGHLVLKDPKDKELWRSQSLTNDSQVSHAAMLDTGNFVIASNNSANIWESFKYPTDTILPTQELDFDGNLLSALDETSYNKGKYQLRFDKGSLILNQIDMFTGKPYNNYSSFETGSRLIFNKSGHIQIQNSTGSPRKLAPENAVPRPDSNYYRATLDFYGVFTLYSYPRNPSGGESWSVLWFRPRDICRSFVDGTATFGNGPCGYNSICELINDRRPNCTCPPGFSFLDENNPYTGCKPDYTSYPEDCNPDGSTNGEDRFDFKPMSFADFPFSDYGILKPATELECKQSCLLDCSCAVAILQDPTLTENGIGTCWKKKLPLSSGWFDRDNIARTALFKVPKSNASRTNQATTKPSIENRNQVILILSVLLGTSAIFNFFSLAAISLIFLCLYQRRLRYLDGIPSGRDLETNLRSFTYKDLEQATNRFKEELGRGAFGTVYKGELPSSYGNYVAVKKLEKFAKEGEKEFKTEVKVIGQTHHKNLVRLLGYCDEGENRLLVYEFMQNGSLASFLFGVLRPSWQRRLQIASGIAKGLTYLHEECNTQIIHCDIKPQNILLDDSFTAKISDFGLSKLLINNNTRTLTGIRGTKGYVAPEWFRNTPVTVKVDVYSFGVMLLEIICRRRCVEVEMEEATILTEWAFECYREGIVEKLVENDEEAGSDVGKLEMLLKVAIWCVQENPLLRPSMRIVTMMLDGAVQVPTPPCPFLVDSMS